MNDLANLFLRVVKLSAVASIVILVVMLARLLLRKAPKVFSYALWGIVLVRLLIPVSIPSPVSAIPETPAVEQYQINQMFPEIEFETPTDRQDNIQSLQNAAQNGGVVVQISRGMEGTYYLTIGWLVGMGVLTLYSVLSYLSIRKKVRISVRLRENIFIADDIKSPFVIGFLRPNIYLPGNLGQQEQEYIILHEQHHIRRFDQWVKALAFLALTIHWFNPFVWVAFVLSAEDMEMSCDEAVIRKAGESIRAEYSASLLTLATGRRIIAGTPLAFGEGNTKGRIRNLANWKRPGFWVILVAIILCIALAFCLLTNPMEDNGENDNGVTWYYGTVVDSAMSVVNEGDREGRSYITLQCDDGEDRLLWLSDGCEKPDEVLGKYVVVRGTTERATGLPIATSIRVTDSSITQSLEESIHQAIIEHNSGKYFEGQCRTAHFKQLSSNETGMVSESGTKAIDQITVYGIALYQEYDLKDGILEDVSGGCCPVVLTFDVGADGILTLTEYWEPRDGIYYAVDIQTKFNGRPFPDVQKYHTELMLNTYAQAMDYFGVGTDVVINTLIDDICDQERWHDSFEDLMEGCAQERAILVAYGSDTLQYCFTEFLKGNQTDTRGLVMAHVCQAIIESEGESQVSNGAGDNGLDWFDIFSSNAMMLKEQHSSDDLKIMYPGSWAYLKMTGHILDIPNWGVTLTAENVTPTGLTIICTQSGGRPTGELFTGSPFVIQVYEDGQWKTLDHGMEDLAWTMEAWGIPKNDTVRWDVAWNWLYGELRAGQYRIGKEVMDFRAAGDYDEAVFYAEFTIE